MTDSSSRLPFHSLPTNFTLDYPDSLTAAQLALSWIAHPDYVSHKHDAAIKHAWHKLRRPLMINGAIGNVPIGPGENNDWPNYGAISIKGSLTNLEVMPSEKLAVGYDTCSFVWVEEGSSGTRGVFFKKNAESGICKQAQQVFLARRAAAGIPVVPQTRSNPVKASPALPPLNESQPQSSAPQQQSPVTKPDAEPPKAPVMDRSLDLSTASTAEQTSTQASSPEPNQSKMYQLPTLTEWRAKMRSEGKLKPAGPTQVTSPKPTQSAQPSNPAETSPASTATSGDKAAKTDDYKGREVRTLSSSSTSLTPSVSNGSSAQKADLGKKSQTGPATPSSRPPKRAHHELELSSPRLGEAGTPASGRPLKQSKTTELELKQASVEPAR